MVWFYRLRDGAWYYIEMGAYEKTACPITHQSPASIATALAQAGAFVVLARLRYNTCRQTVTN